MKINYTLNADSTIQSYTISPLDETRQNIEIADNYQIKLGLDKIIKNKLVKFTGEDENITKTTIWTRINILKNLLAESDYKAIKFAEGELSEEEYASTREQRRIYREEISLLETKLNK